MAIIEEKPKRQPNPLPEKKALELMRQAGHRLMLMHANNEDGRAYYIIPGGLVTTSSPSSSSSAPTSSPPRTGYSATARRPGSCGG